VHASCKWVNTQRFNQYHRENGQLFRGRENLPSDVAIYLVRRYSGGILADVGSHFGIENYSTVSSGVQRIKARGKDGASLQETLSTLEKGLNKGSTET
jgi:hypothetical protein